MKKNLVAILTLVFATSSFCAKKDLWSLKKERIKQKIKILALEERINEAARQRGRLMQIRSYGHEMRKITASLQTLACKKRLLMQILQQND